MNPREVTTVEYAVRDIKLEGDYAYVIVEHWAHPDSFMIWDISDPADIEIMSSFDFSFREIVDDDVWYRIYDLVVADDTVYVAWGGDESCTHIECKGGLLLLDVSDKTNSTKSNMLLGGAAMTSVIAADETLFSIDQYGQLIIFDISDAKNPQRISVLEAELTGLDGNQMAMFANELWVADGHNGLRRFDITDLTWATEKSGYQTDASAQMITIQNELVYLVSGGAGLEVLQKDDSDSLVPLTDAQPIPYATDIVINGQIAYIADDKGGLTAWDLADPLNPVRVGSVVEGGRYSMQMLAGDKLYARSINLAGGHYTVDVFDVSQPLSPTYQLTLPFEVELFTIYDGRAYVTNGYQLSVWDIDNLDSVELLGIYDSPDKFGGGITVKGNVVYVAVEGQILLVLDTSDPNNIQPVYSIDEVQGLYPFWGSLDLQVVGDRLYSICDWAGLCMYDISEPAQPVFLNAISNIIYDFDVAGNYAYISWITSYSTNGVTLMAFDIADTTSIRQITDFPEGFEFDFYWPSDVAVANGTVYVALGSNGLLIFEHKQDANNE